MKQSKGRKREQYQKMFDQLAAIGITLAIDYPSKQKLFEATDFVTNFVGFILGYLLCRSGR